MGLYEEIERKVNLFSEIERKANSRSELKSEKELELEVKKQIRAEMIARAEKEPLSPAPAVKPSYPVLGKTVQITRKSNVIYSGSRHIGTREYQQDSIAYGTGRGSIIYAVLCDGMGGLDDGELASKTAVDGFSRAIEEMDPDCNISEFLVSLAQDVNSTIYTLPSPSGGNSMAGTTLIAIVISDSNLYWISAGDSRLYILREEEIVCVTRDHSYSLELDEMVKAGKITEEEAQTHPKKDALISFLGVDCLEIMDYNTNPFILQNDDIVLLCSDGLYRSLGDGDIAEIIKRHESDIDECARVLPVYAFDRSQGGQDNTSVVLLRYQSSKNVV